MTRYCFFDGKPIPETRIHRGSVYCSEECRQAAQKEAREALAKRKRRYCGPRNPAGGAEPYCSTAGRS